ncbi:zincin [Serendipita vermifera]|nr:zincin [Serendipita vermifera]
MNKANVLATAATLLLFAHSTHAAPSLSMKLSGESVVDDVDNFSVTVNVTNTGDETLKLYEDPRSALSTFPENTFNVAATDGEENPSFAGARVKYGFSDATNFVTLSPGESVVVSHDLSKAYEFAKTGDYNIEAHNLFFYQDASGSPVPLYANVDSTYTAKLSGNIVSTSLTKRRQEGIEKRASQTLYRRGGKLQKRQDYTRCSSQQKADIDRVVPLAMNYVDQSIQYLRALTSGKPRYEKWFGTYRRDRHTVVSAHFNAIKADDLTSYTYDCQCGIHDGTSRENEIFAYVDTTQPKIVNLCGAFWRAKDLGTDSKAGTIVHEASHFPGTADTDDIRYTQPRCIELARNDPDSAIRNADSHEYFAENTPADD